MPFAYTTTTHIHYAGRACIRRLHTRLLIHTHARLSSIRRPGLHVYFSWTTRCHRSYHKRSQRQAYPFKDAYFQENCWVLYCTGQNTKKWSTWMTMWLWSDCHLWKRKKDVVYSARCWTTMEYAPFDEIGTHSGYRKGSTTYAAFDSTATHPHYRHLFASRMEARRGFEQPTYLSLAY